VSRGLLAGRRSGFNDLPQEHRVTARKSHVGLLPTQTVLVAIDCWEHAYFVDYQTKKADYVDGVFEHLNRGPIAARLGRTPAGGERR
jgi:superoxide dismutase